MVLCFSSCKWWNIYATLWITDVRTVRGFVWFITSVSSLILLIKFHLYRIPEYIPWHDLNKSVFMQMPAQLKITSKFSSSTSTFAPIFLLYLLFFLFFFVLFVCFLFRRRGCIVDHHGPSFIGDLLYSSWIIVSWWTEEKTWDENREKTREFNAMGWEN